MNGVDLGYYSIIIYPSFSPTSHCLFYARKLAKGMASGSSQLGVD